jgi:hypothetical protein
MANDLYIRLAFTSGLALRIKGAAYFTKSQLSETDNMMPLHVHTCAIMDLLQPMIRPSFLACERTLAISSGLPVSVAPTSSEIASVQSPAGIDAGPVVDEALLADK